MKCLLVVFSYHHRNTEKIARVIAGVLDAQIKEPQQVEPAQLKEYDLVGFGSGIYDLKNHQSLFDLAERLSNVTSKKVFIFSTCGVPGIGMNNEYVANNHAALREKLKVKGYEIVGEFGCMGRNTNSFLKVFGGINKDRPNSEDLKHAGEFAQNLKEKLV
jgi:flavodoxin